MLAFLFSVLPPVMAPAGLIMSPSSVTRVAERLYDFNNSIPDDRSFTI
jgi:hypothetical protein